MPANTASQPASSSPLASFLDALTAANQGTAANRIAAAADAKKAVSKSGDDKDEKKTTRDKTLSDDASSATSASADAAQAVVTPTTNPVVLIANLGLPTVNPQPDQKASSDSTSGSGGGTSIAVPLQGLTAASAQGQVLASASGPAVSMMVEAFPQASAPTTGAMEGSVDVASATEVPLKGVTGKDTSTTTDITTSKEMVAGQDSSVAVLASTPAVPAVKQDETAAVGTAASAPAISQAVAAANAPTLPTLPANPPVDEKVPQQPVGQVVHQSASQTANQSINPAGDQSQPTAVTNTTGDTPNVAAKADASTAAVVAAISNAIAPMPPAAIAPNAKVTGADGKDASSSKGSAMTDARTAGVPSSDAQSTTNNLFSFQTPVTVETVSTNILTDLVTTPGTDLTVKGVGTKQAVSAKSSGVAGSTKATSKSDDSDADAVAAPSNSSVVVKAVVAPDHAGQQSSTMQNGNGNAEAQQAMQVGVSAAVNATASAATAPALKTETSATADSSQAAVPTSAPSSTGAATLPSVNSAQLIHTMHQSEMRVGMNSNEFGAISINTSISHQLLSAQISTDHSELGRALSMHLPSIEEKLGNAYGLSAKVEVRDNGGSADGNSATQSNGGRQSQSNGSSGGNSSSTLQMAMGDAIPLANTTAVPAVDSARLDIRI